jgi:hypothetical protein
MFDTTINKITTIGIGLMLWALSLIIVCGLAVDNANLHNTIRTQDALNKMQQVVDTSVEFNKNIGNAIYNCVSDTSDFQTDHFIQEDTLLACIYANAQAPIQNDEQS